MSTLAKIISEAKKSLTLIVPLLFSEWLYALNFFVTTWIAAQLGNASLAAMALAQSINFSIMMMISGISAAISILVSQDLGYNNTAGIKHAFAQGVLLNILLAIIAMLILYIAPHFLPFLGINDTQVITQAKTVLHAFMWSLPPMTFLFMFEKFLIGMHRPRMVLFLTIFSIPVSMLANYALVLGKLGMPKCGIAGFGYGFATAYSVLDIMFILLVLVMPSLSQYKLFTGFKQLKTGSKYFGEIWRVGWPLGAMFSIEVGAITAFAFLMSSFGTASLAAFQISRQYLSFAMVTLFALTESTAVRMGFAVGQNDRPLVRRSLYVNIGIGIIFMMVLCCFYLFAQNNLIALDFDITDPQNAQVIAHVKHFLVAIAVLVLCDVVRNITAGGLRSLKDTKCNMYSSVIGYWLVGLPLAYFCGKTLGIGADGLWIGFITGIIISAIILQFRFQNLYAKVDLAKLLIANK
jgi:multidrug resistance protein, MATE family